MKRIYNYILLSVLALAAAGCLEDEFNPGGELVGSDNEVQFGLSLNDPSTKTIYGPENDFGFPLYWSEGDKIQIGSPQWVEGRNYAEYLVTPESGQSYAVAMTKTGEYGVQWGSEEAAVFYSIYPSNGTSWPALTSGNVVAQLNIASEQSANLVLNPASETTSGWYQAADMSNVIMYSQASADKGDVVKLNYKPYSTILEFELGIAQNKDEQGQLITGDNAWGTVKVASMTLTAPTGISIVGDFTLKFNGTEEPTVTAVGNNSNSIKMVFSTQPLLSEENQTLKAKLAMIPISGVKSLDNWKIAVEVLEGTDATTKTYTKTFIGSGEKTTLAPGKIHKIKLPKFSSTEKWVVDPDAWIPTLEDYKNIYITELSLPGAWYAGAPTSEKYQQTSSITDLWNAGVRAFAVECRTLSGFNFLGGGTPEAVVVSGTGRNSTYDDYREPVTGSSTKIRNIIYDIATQVNASLKTDEKGNVDGEFAVLVLSYADGGEGGHRDVDHSYFINGIKNEINESRATSYIYSADELDANTTVSEVLGKLIIKINVDNVIPKGSYAGDANILFSYNPFLQQITDVDFEKPLFSKLYWRTWGDSNKQLVGNSDDFLWCFSSANRTQANPSESQTANTTIPTYAQRQKALKGMMEHSQELTAEQQHHIWFYFNAGGTHTTSSTDKSTSPETFAQNMNPWLYDLVYLKANGGYDTNGVYGTKGAYVESDPSPLGLVMFNHCTTNTYQGLQIIDEIIKMNNKFKLLRANQDAKSAAPSYASGMDTNDSAFGWD